MTTVVRAFALLMLPGHLLHAASGQQRTVVYGIVSDSATSGVLPRAMVTIVGGDVMASSDTAGRFELVVPPGSITLRCALIGYEPRELSLTIGEGMVVRRDIALAPSLLEGEEVSVTGVRTPLAPVRSLNAVMVSPDRALTISGSFNDPYRTIQMLPGVASNNEMSSQFGVRGGSADENLVLLNGARVLEPFHLKESPNTGAGIMPLDAIGSVLFMPGGFPARYGDRLSSVLALTVRQPDAHHWGGAAELSLIGGSVLVEGPVGGGGAGLLSLRSTYSDYVSSFLPSSEERNPWYYDLLGGLTVPLSQTDRLSITLLHAYDRTSGLAEGSYSTSLFTLEEVSSIGGPDTIRGSLSVYRQQDDLQRMRGIFTGGPSVHTSLTSDILQAEARGIAEIAVTEAYTALPGLELQHAWYDVMEQDRTETGPGDSVVTAVLRRNVTNAGVFTENILRSGRWLANAGIRLDHTSSSGETRISPRLLLSFRAGRGTVVKAAWGIYRQSPTYHQLMSAERAGLPPQSMQRAVHYVLGVDQTLRSNIHVRMEAYLKTMDDLVSFRRLRNGEMQHSPRNDARGNVKGIEFEATFSDPRVFGWINVAVMRAEELNLFDAAGWRFRPTDQRKTVTTVFEIRMSERWSLNLRAMYGSGFAYGDDQPGVVDPRKHYPEYKRADVRLSYMVPILHVSSIGYVEVLNVFGYRNAFSFTGETKNPTTPDVNLLLPTVINIGIRAEW